MTDPVYRRVVIKLSGEYLAGQQGFGIDQATMDRVADDLIAARQLGTEVAVVIGGGNIFRGVEVSSRGVSRPTGDTMGMLATMMNCLALEATIGESGKGHAGYRACAMSGVASCPRFAKPVHPRGGAQIPRRGPDRAARRRNRQSVLHHGHDGGAARRRDRRPGGAEGDQCRRRLLGRSEEGPVRHAIRPADAFAGHRRRQQGDGCDSRRTCPRDVACRSSYFRFAEPGSIGSGAAQAPATLD